VDPFPPRNANPEEMLMILPVTGVNHVQEDPPLCLSMSFEIVREARMVPNRFVFKTEVIVS